MPTKYHSQFDDCCQAFAESYEISTLPAMRDVERSVLGCDYGGTSWTTSSQATQIIDMLDLQPELQLLDVGAGSGWPGLYLADTSGCDVTLLDLPTSALAKAMERARGDGIDDRVRAIAGSGAELPFMDATFGAISHSDVLCCLPEKVQMLEECRRVATDHASMLFSVIVVAQGLPDVEHRRAIEAGPPFVDSPAPYADLLLASGWRLTKRIDCTFEHRTSLSALVDAFESNAALSDALGQDAVREGRQRREDQIAAIDAGILLREIYLVTAA